MRDKPSAPDDPHLVAVCFQPSQLTRARELRGLTKTALADQIDKTPSAVTQFEGGNARPDPETVARLALALAVPPRFFARSALIQETSLEACHFRSLRSVSQYLRRQAVRIGEIAQEVTVLLEHEGIEFPEDAVTSLKRRVHDADGIEQLAVDVRRGWGLGLGPIGGVIPLLESKGVRVLPLVDACEDVDAFSTWVGGKPFAMLSLRKSPSRVHFDAVHELGHLLMHEDVLAGSPALESQADEFASAFLMPRETFLAECPTRWSFATFRALKRRWHVSIQALVVRAYRLGRLSLSSYRRAFMDLGRMNMRTNEPDEWVLDGPAVLRQAFEMMGEDLSYRAVADTLALHEHYLAQTLDAISAPGQLSLPRE